MAWLSPSFPVGSFAYSHGLEWAHEVGDVRDACTLQNWLTSLANHGSLRTDAVLLALSHKASQINEEENVQPPQNVQPSKATNRSSCAGLTRVSTSSANKYEDKTWIPASSAGMTKVLNNTNLNEIIELASALAPSSERHLETIQQGNSLLRIARDAWNCEALTQLQGDIAYPVALGVLAQGHAVPLETLLPAFGIAFISNLTSAAIRLGVIGQTDGQRTIKALIPAIENMADFAQTATIDDLGSCAFRSDIASMRHETQYTRIFRS
jgi:urease accessory protein